MTTRILYVAGWMRSGTTLLCEMLGACEDTIAVGELSGIWLALDKDHPCACGQPLSTCPLWSSVVARVRAEHPDADFADLAQLSKRVLRTRDSHRLYQLRKRPHAQWPSDVRRYVDVMSTLYVAIAEQSGCRNIIDSSKLPPSILIQALVADVETRVVHISRDPRAVANSERKTIVRNGPNPELTPPGKNPLRSALLWSGANLAVALTSKVSKGSVTVRYEDLTTQLDCTLDDLCRTLGLERGGDVMASGHIAVGNPARMQGATRQVKRDDRWRTELPWPSKALVSVVTLPARLCMKLLCGSR